jgi:hypothetical protein
MTPLPVNPKVVILTDANNKPIRVASNVAPVPELDVIVTNDPAKYRDEALGKPFEQGIALPNV